MEQRIERLEDRVDKLEERQQKHAEEFAETKVYVKHIYKKIEEIVTSLEILKTASNLTRDEGKGEWKQFFEKGFWLVAGAIVAFIIKN